MVSISKDRYRQLGFTITELTAVIVVLGIMIIPLSGLSIDYFTHAISKSTEAQLATESQTLLRTVTEELRTASSVKETSDITDPNEPSSGWSTSNANLILIISQPAVNSSRQYIINPLTSTPYQNEIIYFVSGNTLYRRTLAHPDATGSLLRRSCPSASASQSCPADQKLTEHFSAMNFILYDQDDNPTTSINSARSLIVTVVMQKKMFRTITFENSMRMTMRNSL